MDRFLFHIETLPTGSYRVVRQKGHWPVVVYWKRDWYGNRETRYLDSFAVAHLKINDLGNGTVSVEGSDWRQCRYASHYEHVLPVVEAMKMEELL